MSKKSGKGRRSKKNVAGIEFDDTIENIEQEITEESNSPAVDIGYLTSAIIEYYESTGDKPLDEGDEWKNGTDYAPKLKSTVPSELDSEIKKAFLFQIKKFQK